MTDTLAARVLRSVRMLPHGAIEVGVLRHRIDTAFVSESARLLAEEFRPANPTLVLAPAVSGVPTGTVVAVDLGVPILMARKEGEARGFVIHRSAYSSSEGIVYDLHVAREDLLSSDRVLIVDDLMQHGQTTAALVEMVREVKAEVVGVATVVEIVPTARNKLRNMGLPEDKIKSLVQLEMRGSAFALAPFSE